MRVSVLYTSIVHNFCVSFGVILGASLFSGIGAILTNKPPMKSMIDIAGSIKIWAMAIALGDTFSSYAVIEKGLFSGEFKSIAKQGIYVLTALVGANLGYSFIKLLERCGQLWNK
ncbi:YtrH family sporulation protein [Mobilitalea sibirica]|uniref:YtrH family sporulation protein n=2 Tax=Mobilitalea sibirica TaxID=1462919 RepID=A0A8J7KXI2_9FIRM|nr:YtrH family sporulation protein [Mobilitalea sibirica]MBH1942565.1 YtrH family sporulation protein [Mobilitalea sibirica]